MEETTEWRWLSSDMGKLLGEGPASQIGFLASNQRPSQEIIPATTPSTPLVVANQERSHEHGLFVVRKSSRLKTARHSNEMLQEWHHTRVQYAADSIELYVGVGLQIITL